MYVFVRHADLACEPGGPIGTIIGLSMDGHVDDYYVEREIKLRFDSADAGARRDPGAPARRRCSAGASRRTRCSIPRTSRCADGGCVLRVRMENGKSRITFKGPVQPSSMKLREEVETVVGDGEVLLRVFEELGFHVWFRYEKYREEFSHEDVIVAIDETPVGVFVEIEGSEQRHRRRWPRRSAARRPTTSSIPIAGCSCSTARQLGICRRRHGLRSALTPAAFPRALVLDRGPRDTPAAR